MSGFFGQCSGQADLVALQTVESRSPAGGGSDTKQRRSGPGAPFVDTAHRGKKKIESTEKLKKNKSKKKSDTWRSRGNFPVDLCMLPVVLKKTKIQVCFCFQHTTVEVSVAKQVVPV